jgi:ElaB/YqjD/DUF883 family membrane-anchored ribosome-binding protein
MEFVQDQEIIRDAEAAECSVLSRAATSIGKAAGYLHASDTKAIALDLESWIARAPVRSMTSAAAIGMLLGAFVRHSGRQRG